MKCIQVGLIGFGFAGRIFHSSAIAAVEGLELAAIVQRTGSEAALAFPHAKILPSVDALLAEASIQVVIVATPNTTHFPIAKQCLLAGRDVVLDKPFALSSVEAAELIQLARTTGRLLSVFHNRRWDGDFLTVRKLLDGDRVGRLVAFESHYDRYRQLPLLCMPGAKMARPEVEFCSTLGRTWSTRPWFCLVHPNPCGPTSARSGRGPGAMTPSTFAFTMLV